MTEKTETISTAGRSRQHPYPALDRNVSLEQDEKITPLKIGIELPDIDVNVAPKIEPTFSIEGPKPILQWHPAKTGVLEETAGSFDELFPSLRKLSDREFMNIVKRERTRRI